MSSSDTFGNGNTVRCGYAFEEDDNQWDELLGDRDHETKPAMTAKERKREAFDKKFPGFQFCAPVDAPILRDTRYEFGAPLKFQVPHRHDLVFIRAARVVQEYNELWSPLVVHADPLRVEALNAAPVVLEPYACETTSVVHCLVRHQLFVKVQLRLSRDPFGDWESSTVMLKDGDRWIPLRTFLKTLKTYVQFTGFSGFREQHSWWRSMGKPFRILDLPQELQDRIWLFAMGERVTLGCHVDKRTQTDRFSLTKGTPRPERKLLKDRRRSFLVVPRTCTAVLRLNKSINENAKKILDRDTTMCFHDINSLGNVLPHPPTGFLADFGKCIRRLELGLDLCELITTFDVTVAPFKYDANYSGVSFSTIRSSMPNLESLHIIFVPSSSPHYTHNPWTTYFIKNRAAQRTFPDFDFLRPACHSRYMDWVMAFAASSLSGIRTVKLTGEIKTCIKKKWEGTLNGGPSKAGDQEIERLKSEARDASLYDLPPQCFCPLTCTSYLVDYDDKKSNETHNCYGHQKDILASPSASEADWAMLSW